MTEKKVDLDRELTECNANYDEKENGLNIFI